MGWQSGEETHCFSFLQILEALVDRREIPFVQRAKSELVRRTDLKVLVQHKEQFSLIKHVWSLWWRMFCHFEDVQAEVWEVILAVVKHIQTPEGFLLSISGLVLSSELHACI